VQEEANSQALPWPETWHRI